MIIVNLEDYLKRYPQSGRRLEIEEEIYKLAIKIRDRDRTITYAEKQLERNPAGIELLTTIVSTLRVRKGSGDMTRALDYAERLVKQFESLIESSRKPGRLSAAQWQEQKDEGRASVYLVRGRVLAEIGQLEKAKSDLRKSFDLLPLADAALALSEVAENQQRREDALNYALQAFVITLAGAGIVYALYKRQQPTLALVSGAAVLLGALALVWLQRGLSLPGDAAITQSTNIVAPSLATLFGSGLRSGLLTFGGAYTVLSYLQHDAVVSGHWMTNAQFLDGVALTGILPAPMVIFGTFVGFVGGGLPGALLLTAGIFLPAFSFTLIGHDYVERLIANEALHSLLDGVTAGVVGLIAATTIVLLRAAITDLPALLIFTVGLVLLFRWTAKATIPVVVLGAGVAGWLFSLV